MKLTTFIASAVTAVTLSITPVVAGEMMMIKDPYMRSSTPSSVTGAAFLMLMNHGETDDRLVSASADVAGRVELHTHIQDENGVMKMMEVEEGFVIPAGEMYHLKRGGDHIMFMGLNRPLEQGEEIPVTLTFEKAGDIEVMIPVDRERKADHGAMGHDHSSHSNDS
ncbi:MAG: copper chaperone PCu(A)C [Pseudomonadota bacterium]